MARNLDEPGANFNQLLELSIKLQNARTFAGTKVADASTEMEQSEFLEPKRIDIFGNVIPAETLENWDPTFRKPNAAGGRIYGKYAQQLASGGRVGYGEGDIVPKVKPSEEEIKKIKWMNKLNILKKAKGGMGHRGWLNFVSEHLDDGLKAGIISKEQFNEAIMPLFGQAGEVQTRALGKDDSLPVKDLLELQGEKREDYPDYLLAKGGRVGLAEGDTPSQAWMRDYFYSGKGGYDDSGMTFQFFSSSKGPGPDLWFKFGKK